MVAQTTNMSSDGTSPNRLYDCVPASIGSAILWYEGKSQWDSTINPDKLLDMAYPEGYQGGTAAINFVEPCAKLGYYLYPINGDPAHLVQAAHLQLANGHPVVFTEPDPYSANPNDSHVCVFYADGATNGQQYLISMDPFPLPGTASGHPVHRFDSDWQQQLLFNQVWIVEKLPPQEDIVSIDLNIPEVAHYFQAVPGNAQQWKCVQGGKDGKSLGRIVQYGILSYYCTGGKGALAGLTDLGLPKSNEIAIEKINARYQSLAGHGIVIQYFERQNLCYDPKKLIDNPPGSGSVYALQLFDGGPGTDPLIAQLEDKITALQNAPITADMQQIKTIASKY